MRKVIIEIIAAITTLLLLIQIPVPLTRVQIFIYAAMYFYIIRLVVGFVYRYFEERRKRT